MITVCLAVGSFLITIAITCLLFFVLQRQYVSKWNKLAVPFIPITIFLLIFFMMNIHFKNQLEKRVHELQQNGISTTLQDIIPVAVSPDENGAKYYKQAFEKIKNNRDVEELINIIWNNDYSLEKMTPTDKERAIELVYSSEIQNIYMALDKGINKPKCNFNNSLDYMSTITPSVEVLNSRDCARLLAAKAIIEANSGDYKKAFDTLASGFKMGEILNIEPSIISQRVRFAMNYILVKVVMNITEHCDVPTSVLESLILELQKLDNINAAKRTVSRERILYETYHYKKMLEGYMLDHHEYVPHKIFCLYFRPFIWKEYLYYVDVMVDFEASFDYDYPTCARRIDKELEHRLGNGVPGYFLFSAKIPSIVFFRKHVYDRLATLRLCIVGLALKVYKNNHGQYPDELKELKPTPLTKVPLDPFSNQSFIYKKRNDSFILYSIGPNMKNDSGPEQPVFQQSGDDIAWTALCR